MNTNSILLTEAINSVAMSHPSSCACDVCLAADGDTDALARTLVSVQEKMLERQGVEDDLTPRQEMILRRIRAGEAECGLCGDYGALNGVTGEGVPCLSCGRDRPKIGLV